MMAGHYSETGRGRSHPAEAEALAREGQLNCQSLWHGESHSVHSTCPAGFRCNAPSKWFTTGQHHEWQEWRKAARDA